MVPLYDTRETFSNVALYQNILTNDPKAELIPTIYSICTDEYSMMEYGALRMPECSHVFCAFCIKMWFDTAGTYPMCRKEFFPIHPEVISAQMNEVRNIHLQISSLLNDAERLYPQRRHPVDTIQEMLAILGHEFLNEAKVRKERRLHRQKNELSGLGDSKNRYGDEETKNRYNGKMENKLDWREAGSRLR
jgi:hypothetical protein